MDESEARKKYRNAVAGVEIAAIELERQLIEDWKAKHPNGVNGEVKVFKVEDGEIFTRMVTPDVRDAMLKGDHDDIDEDEDD